jgi:DHA3 family tetracycline resistance protein-like MFS transporter
MALLRSFRHRSFTLIWSGQTISRLGDSLYRIALSWWVLEKTGSAAIMGTVLIFSFTPMLIFSLIGGVAVDRFPRIRVMILSDLLRGVTVLVVSLLAYARLLEVWHIFAASVVFGLVDAFFQPAYTAVLPEITPRELLPSANSLTSLSWQLANVAGPALGAALVSLGGTSLGFALDGLSFFISAVCLLPLLKLPLPPREGLANLRLLADLKVGLKVVFGSPWLWITIALAALSNVTLSGPLSVSTPFLIKDTLGRDVKALGMVYSFSSAGSVLAAVWLGRYSRLRRRGPALYLAWIIGSLMCAGFGMKIPYEGILAAAVIFGACMSAVGLIWVNTLQELVPSDLLGRVSSIDNLGSFALLPIGYGLAGLLTDQVGAPLVFLGGGLISAGLTVLGLLHPAIRRLD